MPVATTRPITLLVATMLMVVAVTIGAGIAGIEFVNSIRSIASGGTHYAKSHLSAVAALRRFARTGREADFRDFETRLDVAVSVRLAREILERAEGDVAESHEFLVAGKNHPDDVAGIAWLYRHFHRFDLFAPAAETWRQADRDIQRLETAAAGLRDLVRSDPKDVQSRLELLRIIDDLDSRLLAWEEQFAEDLGHAARAVTRLLWWGMLGLGGSLAVLIFGLGVVTARRLQAAARAIRQREERFKDVAEVAADWIWETDEHLRFSYISGRLEELLGLPAAFFLGKTREANADSVNPEAWKRHRDDLLNRRMFRSFDYQFSHPTTGTRHFRVSGKPVFDERGVFLGYRGTGSDVTAEIEARRTAQEKQALLETTFEHMSQGIIVVDGDLTVVAFNRRFLELFGFPETLVAPGDSFEAIVRYQAENGAYGPGLVDRLVADRMEKARHPAPRQIRRMRPNDVVVEVREEPLPSGGFVITYTDITKQYYIEKNLLEARNAAESASHAKSLFLANMSHELRTPLNAIIGFSEILASARFGPISERYMEYATDIRFSGQHLLSMIDDILDLTKIEAGRETVRLEPVDLHRLADDCIRILEPRAAESGIALENQVPPTAPPVLADRRLLRQILINLLGNGIKFSHNDTSVSVRYLKSGRHHGFCVVDQGIGMDPTQIDAAFEPFAQLDNGFDRTVDGSGLGLTLVRKFVKLHGGEVDVDSRPRAGTTVTVLFPEPSDTGRCETGAPIERATGPS